MARRRCSMHVLCLQNLATTLWEGCDAGHSVGIDAALWSVCFGSACSKLFSRRQRLEQDAAGMRAVSVNAASFPFSVCRHIWCPVSGILSWQCAVPPSAHDAGHSCAACKSTRVCAVKLSYMVLYQASQAHCINGRVQIVKMLLKRTILKQHCVIFRVLSLWVPPRCHSLL